VCYKPNNLLITACKFLKTKLRVSPKGETGCLELSAVPWIHFNHWPVPVIQWPYVDCLVFSILFSNQWAETSIRYSGNTNGWVSPCTCRRLHTLFRSSAARSREGPAITINNLTLPLQAPSISLCISLFSLCLFLTCLL